MHSFGTVGLQWDYSGKWNTRKKCKNHIEYICSVEANDLGLKMPKLVALFGGKMNEHALLLTPNEKAGLIPSLRQ